MKNFITRFICILAIVGLMAGCAGLFKFSQDAETIMCNPPQNVMDVVKAAAPVIATAISMLVPGSAPYLAAVDAAAIVGYIQQGACISLTQLNNLITFLGSDAVKTAQVKMVAGKKAAPIKVFNIQPLIIWAGKK